VLNTAGGAGVGNALETSVHNLAGVNATSGDIAIANDVDGPLTLGIAGSVVGLTNSGGGIWVVNNGAITVQGPVSAVGGGTISLEAAANGGDDDHLVVNAPISGTELEFVIMVIAVSCVKLLSAHNSTQHTSRKHKV
jgi:hypothetical protein